MFVELNSIDGNVIVININYIKVIYVFNTSVNIIYGDGEENVFSISLDEFKVKLEPCIQNFS